MRSGGVALKYGIWLVNLFGLAVTDRSYQARSVDCWISLTNRMWWLQMPSIDWLIDTMFTTTSHVFWFFFPPVTAVHHFRPYAILLFFSVLLTLVSEFLYFYPLFLFCRRGTFPLPWRAISGWALICKSLLAQRSQSESILNIVTLFSLCFAVNNGFSTGRISSANARRIMEFSLRRNIKRLWFFSPMVRKRLQSRQSSNQAMSISLDQSASQSINQSISPFGAVISG